MQAFTGLGLIVVISALAFAGKAYRGAYLALCIAGLFAVLFLFLVLAMPTAASTLETFGADGVAGIKDTERTLCWYSFTVMLGGLFGAILFKKKKEGIAA